MSEEKELIEGSAKAERTVPHRNMEGFAASVELPEGHQLVIGELPPGTVVEVATWQGTGRPDETTSRFLLSAAGSGLQRREREKTQKAELLGARQSAELPTEARGPQRSSGSIVSGDYLGLRSYGTDQKEAPMAGKRLGKLTQLARGIFAGISVIAILSLVLSLLGFGAVVPKRGIETTFGASSHSLVIYKKSPDVALGEPTVAEIVLGQERTIIFGPSSAFDDSSLRIQTNGGEELVQRNSIKGRAFLAVPIIGWLLSPILG